MAIPFATEDYRISHLVKKEQWPEFGWSRLLVTVNEAAAKEYVLGTVLGKVTANGKYKIAVQTAVDGSQTAAALVLGKQSIPATTDTKVLVLVRDAIVSKAALVLDATYDLDAEKQAAYDSLKTVGILAETQV